MRIRKATIKDADDLINIGNSVEEFKVDSEGNTFWDKKPLVNWIKSNKDIILIAEDKGKIIGFVMFACHTPTGKTTWENAWMHPDYRGKGIIDKLYNKAEIELKKEGTKYIFGLAKPSSKASIKMQKRLGFDEGLKFVWMGKVLK